MPNTEVNISLKSKSNPVINITTLSGGFVDSGANIVPTISFINIGSQGPAGPAGENGLTTIEDNSITQSHLANNSVGTNQIINGSVGYDELAVASVRGNRIMQGTIGTIRLADDAVTQLKLANNSVGPEQIIDGTITKELLQDLAIDSDKIEDLTIQTGKLQDNVITTIKISDRNVTGAKICSNADLDGEVKCHNLKLKGLSPAVITGPDTDSLQIKSNNTIDFLDSSGNTIASLDQSGNLTISGTVDGRDIAADGVKLDGISDSEIIDWSVAQTENIHSSNYTDTNTQLPFIDEDNMASNSSSHVPSQQSVKSYVDDQVAGIVDSAPNTLNTLNELADALGDDENFSTTVTNNIATKAPIASPTFTGTVAIPNIANLEQAITANTAKTGITTSQANAITANTAKPDLTVDGAGTVHANNYTDTQYNIMGSGNGYAAGLVKAGGVVHNNAFLRKDGSWAIPTDTNTTYSEATSSAEGLMSTAHHDKLDGIATGAEVNVQSDWNSSSGDSQILNKPTIPVDLTSDGTGTIHANNVPTLNQDTTGNASTADALTNGNKSLAGSLTSKGLIVDGNVSVTPGDGAAIHVDTADITDNATSASGTALAYNHVAIENPRVIASNSNVTTSKASTLYIKGAPVVGTNMTFTNAYAIYVGGGDSYFANVNVNDLTVRGNDIKDDDGTTCITFDSSGNTTIANTLNASLTGNVTGNASGSSGSCTGNAATATNLVASTSTAVQLGTIELGHASDTTIARTAAGTVTIEGNTIATTNKLIDTKTAGYWSSSTSGFYITLSGSSTAESSSLSTASYTAMYVVPFDGKIKRITSFHQQQTTCTTTLEMYIDGDDSDLTNDQRGSDMTTSAYGRKFTEDCPADWTFSKGEAIAIRRTDTVARYGTTMTIVFEYDTTT